MVTNYRSKMSRTEEAEYNAYLLEQFNQICVSAHRGEELFGSGADMKAHTSMSNVYYAYFIGAKALERCKKDTEKIRHEYINEKTREAMDLEGWHSSQRLYHKAGELVRAYRQGECAADVFAEKIIAIVDGRD